MADALGLLFKITADSSTAQREIKALSNTVSREVSQIKRIAGDGFKNVESSALSMGSAFKAAGIGIAAIGTVAIAAAGSLFALVKSTAEAGAQIYDMSQKTGLAAETLSALKNATEESGGNFKSISTSLGIFDKNIESAAQGGKKMSAVFKALSIDTKSNEQALRDAFRALMQIPAGAERTAAALQLFGRSGKDLLGVIEQTNGNIDAAIEKYRQLGSLIGKDAASAANKFRDQLVELEQQLAGVARTIGFELMPMVSEGIKSISNWLRDNRDTVKDWAKTFAETVANLANFLGPIIRGLIDSFSNLNSLLKMAKGEGSGGRDIVLRNVQAISEMMPQMSPQEEAQLAQDNPSLAAMRAALKARIAAQQLGANTYAGLGMSGADKLLSGPQAAPHLPSFGGGGGRGGGGRAAKAEKGPEDFGASLLADLERQYESLGRKSDDLANKTIFQRVQVALLDEKYRGLSPQVQREIETEARLIDARTAGLEVAEKTKKAQSELRDFLEKQTEQLREMTEGEKTAYDVGQDFINSLERQGFSIQQVTKDFISLNSISIMVLDSIKKFKDLDLPDIAQKMFPGLEGGGPGIGQQIEAMIGAAPVMSGAISTIDLLGEKLSNFFGTGMEGAKTWGDAIVSVFSGVAQAAGSMVEAFLIGGDHSAAAFGKMAKAAIASVAAQAAVHAIFELAMGLASLWLNPAEAATHFLAAKTFGLVAGMAAAASLAIPGGGAGNRAVAGTALRSSSSGSANSSSSPASIDVGRTGGGRLANVVEKLANTVDRLTSASPGQVLIAGAGQAPHAITNTLRDDFRMKGITRQIIVDQRA